MVLVFCNSALCDVKRAILSIYNFDFENPLVCNSAWLILLCSLNNDNLFVFSQYSSPHCGLDGDENVIAGDHFCLNVRLF